MHFCICGDTRPQFLNNCNLPGSALLCEQSYIDHNSLLADANHPALSEKDTDAQRLSPAKPQRHSRRVAATAAPVPEILVGGILDPIAEGQEEACSLGMEDVPARDAILKAEEEDDDAASDVPISMTEAAGRVQIADGVLQGRLK